MDTGRKDANIQIGKRLREARLNMNLEKSEIADVLGVTVEHYRKLEAGVTGISVDKVLTLYHKYGIDVFEVITFDYISKPITVEKLESVLLKAMQYLHMIKRDFVFQFRKNQFRISCDDIVYFEKKGRQAVIHTISENFKANMTTEEIWKQLDDKVFAHIHVSYIINLGHIRAIDGDEVVMDNEERLLIARSHKQNLKEKHMEFVRRMV